MDGANDRLASVSKVCQEAWILFIMAIVKVSLDDYLEALQRAFQLNMRLDRSLVHRKTIPEDP